MSVVKKCVLQVIHILLFEKCHHDLCLVSHRWFPVKIGPGALNLYIETTVMLGTTSPGQSYPIIVHFQLADEKLWIFILFSQNMMFKKNS